MNAMTTSRIGPSIAATTSKVRLIAVFMSRPLVLPLFGAFLR
jgi:hypothetical protein